MTVQLRYLAPTLALAMLLAACAPASAPAKPAAAPVTVSAPTAAQGPTPPPAAAAPAQPAAAAAPAPPPTERVSVGWVRSLNLASFNVAQGRGYFQEQGVLLEPTEFRSAADIVSALGTGQLDVNAGTISAGTFNAWQRGVHMIVAAPSSEFPAEGLMPQTIVARKDLWDSGAVRTLADARGRRVSLNVRGGINEFVLDKTLARRGLTLAEVELVPLPFPDQPAALSNGSIDISTATEPFGTQALVQGVGVRLDEDQQSIGPIQPTHFLFSENFANARAEVAVRFLAAVLRANREMQGNWTSNAEMVKIVEDEVGVRRDLLLQASLPRFPLDLAPRLQDIQAMQEAFMKEGHITYSTPLDISPFINATLAERARQRLDTRP